MIYRVAKRSTWNSKLVFQLFYQKEIFGKALYLWKYVCSDWHHSRYLNESIELNQYVSLLTLDFFTNFLFGNVKNNISINF